MGENDQLGSWNEIGCRDWEYFSGFRSKSRRGTVHRQVWWVHDISTRKDIRKGNARVEEYGEI